METISDVLFLLLNDSALRSRFMRGEKLVFDPQVESDLASIDKVQLQLLAQKMESKIFSTPIVGGKNITEIFSKTFSAALALEPDLIAYFARSPEYAHFSDLNLDPKSIGLEEAFYLYLAKNFPSLEAQARHEFLSAHLQNLGATQNPSFRISRLVNKTETGYVSIQEREGQYFLYAIAGLNFISGEIDFALAKKIEKFVIQRQGYENASESDAQIIEELKALGLIT